MQGLCSLDNRQFIMENLAPLYSPVPSTFHHPSSRLARQPRATFGKAQLKPRCNFNLPLALLNVQKPQVNISKGQTLQPRSRKSFSFTRASRFAPLMHYEHYEREEKDLDVDQADKYKRLQSPTFRTPLELRFKSSATKTPGPQYLPAQTQTKPQNPVYSMPPRRGAPFTSTCSTPRQVGPGSYYTEYSSRKKAGLKKATDAFIGTQPRFFGRRGVSFNQSYDVESSFGRQNRTARESSPSYSLGKRNRDSAEPILAQHMDCVPQRVRLPHPK